MDFNLRCVEFRERQQLLEQLASVGASPEGCQLMVEKGLFLALRVDHLSGPAALILKQELLAIGGEVALHKQVIVHGVSESSALMLATRAQYHRLTGKLRQQPFKLAVLADQLDELLSISSKHIIHTTKQDLLLGEQTLIMGIVNVTPDSFYDGGQYLKPQQAIDHILALAEAGADIIDIGGMSSRPDFTPITAEEEMSRIIPVIEAVAPLIKQPISVDTEKAEVAEAALAAGASIINDIDGCTDQAMRKLVANSGAPVVVMHNSRGVPHGEDIVGEMLVFFRQRISELVDVGVRPEQIILDPGLGFGKNTGQNLMILRELKQLKSLDYPLLVAASHKRFIGEVLDLPVEERIYGSLAVTALASINGADLVRVHDVAETLQVLKIMDAVRRTK